MGDITREELAAYTDAQNKVATVLEKIASRLEEAVSTQKIIVDKLSNGVVKQITEAIRETCQNCVSELESEENDLSKRLDRLLDNQDKIRIGVGVSEGYVEILKEIKSNTSATKLDSRDLKFFVGFIAVAIIIVTSLVTVITRGVQLGQNESELIQEIRKFRVQQNPTTYSVNK